MTKKEYYEKMRALFTKHFGEDFKERKREIKKRLETGEAPEINELYRYVVYDLNLFGGCHQGSGYMCQRMSYYSLWDYDRLSKLFKHM